MIRKWSEVLRRRMMWRGCSDNELCWWCVKSWDGIRMVHGSMRNGSRVEGKLYMQRVLLALEEFRFFSLYMVSCIANQLTTLTQLRLWPCSDPSKRTSSALVLCMISHYLFPISPATILPVTDGDDGDGDGNGDSYSNHSPRST